MADIILDDKIFEPKFVKKTGIKTDGYNNCYFKIIVKCNTITLLS